MACERFKFLKILNVIKTISIPLTMFPLLLCGYKSIAMVVVTSLYNLLYNVCTMYCCFKKLKMKIYFSIRKIDVCLFKEIFKYSFFVFLGLIVDTVFNNTDQVILGSICGTVAVSIYSIGTKIISMDTTVSTTISGLFLPKITKMLEEETPDQNLSDIFIKVSRIQIYIMMLILAGFIVFGRQFINLWVGPEYHDTYFIILLIIGPAIIPLTQNIGISVIQAKNKHQFRSIVYLLIAILNIVISIPLAKKYQGIGAAAGSAIATILGQIITMNVFYWKKINLEIPKYWIFFIKFSIKVFFISIVYMIIIRNIEFNWIKLIIFGGLYIMIYIVAVYITMNAEEKKYVDNLRKKIIQIGEKYD